MNLLVDTVIEIGEMIASHTMSKLKKPTFERQLEPHHL
jgi:hypothetical protein